ncbi:MAG: hypothetical protein JWO90_843 [Solirubrobacterales bacterium]|nr:hypothetical protein [Solirubrobacterales bacterium]
MRPPSERALRAAGGLSAALLWALAAPAGSAAAASIALDRACYVSGLPGVVTLAGFRPGAVVVVASPDLGATRVVADGAGGARVPITPPSGNGLPGPGSARFEVSAAEEGGAEVRTVARVAPLAFQTATGARSPKVQRAWAFSGWMPGRPVYAHFRYRGRTRGTHRFGVAGGVCGELRARAAAIVVRGAVPAGTWTIQVDQRRTYARTTRPSLQDETVVFPTFRPRGAAALGATPLGLLPAAA